MEYEGIRRPMLVSLAVRHAQVPSSAIHRSLAQCRLLWNPGGSIQGNLTVPRNNLHDIDGTSASEQVFPPPYEKPVISAINPLGMIQRRANEKTAMTYVLIP
jgi:hypothetical protein